MITAIDTNVLLDVLIPNEQFFEDSALCLENAVNAGSAVICDLVFAELCIHFSTQHECDEFLDRNKIRVESLKRDALFLAGRVWKRYRQQGGKRARILADFLIGAHAQTQATRLLSRDRGFYKELFPTLELVNPMDL